MDYLPININMKDGEVQGDFGMIDIGPYDMWAIEYGYKIEALRSQRDGLVEMNRALRLEEASLRDPERIDVMARKLGMQSPQPGQVVRMDLANDAATPVMASIAPVAVVSAW